MYFSLHNILPVVWIALAVALVAMTYLLTVYRNITRVRPTSEADPDPAELPAISVVVYASDNADALRRMLPDVLAQEYPQGKMEVIVVNDGSSEDVADVVNYLAQSHSNLYLTFVPEEAHNLSRKKLAISLGIKAARNEVILLTTAACIPGSPRWAALMAAPFLGEKEVVIGWATVAGLKKSMLRFDQAFTGSLWLSAAENRRPYRGTGFNLAYTRTAFFRNKGFSRSLNLHNGDDDIFISEIANSSNTSVVISDDARVTVEDARPASAYRDLRLRHCFTARRLPRRQSRLAGFSTVAIWLWVVAVAVGCVFALPNWWPCCLFAATIPALWIPLTVNWLRTGRTLGIRLNAALLWWQMLWHWIPNRRLILKSDSRKRRNYTWLQK